LYSGICEGPEISGNLFPTEEGKSAGILLTGVGAGFSVTGSLISGNGYGLFNADITNTTVREAAAAEASGNFWGTSGTPIIGPTEVTNTGTVEKPVWVVGAEGVSGDDGAAGKTVTLQATITDSAGVKTTTTIEVPVKATEVVPPKEEVKPPVTPPVTPAAPPSGAPKVGAVKLDKAKGMAALTIAAPGAGKLVVSGPGVAKVTMSVGAGGDVGVSLKAKGKALKTLNEKGKVSVKITIAFTPSGGATVTKTKTVVLKKTL
jgi:hypothetical protein